MKTRTLGGTDLELSVIAAGGIVFRDITPADAAPLDPLSEDEESLLRSRMEGRPIFPH